MAATIEVIGSIQSAALLRPCETTLFPWQVNPDERSAARLITVILTIFDCLPPEPKLAPTYPMNPRRLITLPEREA